jgi:hypothetical protein
MMTGCFSRRSLFWILSTVTRRFITLMIEGPSVTGVMVASPSVLRFGYCRLSHGGLLHLGLRVLV